MGKQIKAVTLEEAIKDMTQEELERFKKERYEKFIRPIMENNAKELEKVKKDNKESCIERLN